MTTHTRINGAVAKGRRLGTVNLERATESRREHTTAARAIDSLRADLDRVKVDLENLLQQQCVLQRQIDRAIERRRVQRPPPKDRRRTP